MLVTNINNNNCSVDNKIGTEQKNNSTKQTIMTMSTGLNIINDINNKQKRKDFCYQLQTL